MISELFMHLIGFFLLSLFLNGGYSYVGFAIRWALRRNLEVIFALLWLVFWFLVYICFVVMTYGSDMMVDGQYWDAFTIIFLVWIFGIPLVFFSVREIKKKFQNYGKRTTAQHV